MSRNLQNAFSGASQSTGTVVANVTKAFADRGHAWDLYADDIKGHEHSGTHHLVTHQVARIARPPTEHLHSRPRMTQMRGRLSFHPY